ncbi:MAG: quinone-dependent dihydroorotate dehydrogenase [Saprospiraceae bacterium]|nr:quinone-dependent dihydroorotate dehydrogenase [Saprospiraceae bacterium]
MYKTILKPLLFVLSPENAHLLTVILLKISIRLQGVKWLMKKCYSVENSKLNVRLWGLDFQNPVGLAAGFDKDGKYYNVMEHLGFGFVEIGTVTPLPQPGNEKPRLFRLPKDRALINRMGFNNDGVEAMVKRLRFRTKTKLIIGGNIGKNKLTPNENASEDYLRCFESLFEFCDYFVVNVSSPNTPGLRELQDKEPLTNLLITLMKKNNSYDTPKPILLKIAPDLTNDQLDDIIEIVGLSGIHGIVATNTTLDRSNIASDTTETGSGGLSGAPLKSRATEIIRYIHTKTSGQIPIIGVGGIENAADAIEKINAGASLIQIYTGLIYNGPGLIRDINKAIISL